MILFYAHQPFNDQAAVDKLKFEAEMDAWEKQMVTEGRYDVLRRKTVERLRQLKNKLEREKPKIASTLGKEKRVRKKNVSKSS